MDCTNECFSCKKEVAGDFVRCTVCKNNFHPGCYKPHRTITSKGEKLTCTGTAEAVRKASSTPSLAGPSSPATPVASKEPSLTTLMATMQTCVETVNALRADLQAQFNTQADGLKKDFDARMKRVSAELGTVLSKVKQVESEVTNLKGEVRAVAKKSDTAIEALAARMTALENEHKSYADAVKTFPRRICLLEEEKRATEVVISGLPQRQEEDLHQLVITLAANVAVPLERASIVRVSRMRGSDDPERPRLIHAVLSSKYERDALLAGKRKKGQLMATEIERTLASRPVYINEYLPRDVLTLLRSVRSEARSRGYRFVWHRAGTIFVKKDSDSKAIAINNSEELATKLE